MWKTHLCRVAHHLFLMVPVETMNAAGAVRERPYRSVVKRLGTFFSGEHCYVDVRSVHVMGF